MPGIAAPRGTRDLLPDASPAWEWLYAVHARVAGEFGYQLVDTPVYEHTELIERGVGVGTDVVDKETFTFDDRGGRSITLRPEGTAGVLRAVLSASLTQEIRPLRVRYAGPMFRAERPQHGRYRQFFQVGVECIGETSPHLDAEIIELGWRFLEELGLDGVSLQVNSLGDAEDRRRYREALIAYYEPHYDSLCDDCKRRLRINPLRLLDCKRDSGLVAGAPRIADSLSPESSAYFATVLADLRDAGIAHEVNPRLVRGLDYYSHTAFEFWHSSLQGAQNALGGGGRYDGLAEVLGFAPTPGVGYAFGVERLLMTAAPYGRVPAAEPACDALVAAIEPAQAKGAAAVARSLRGAGIRTVLDVSDRKIDRKLRYADRLGARAIVLVGPDEQAENAATVRDMRTREQRRVPLADLADAVAQVLATAPPSPAPAAPTQAHSG
ncbi:MAG TPA: histidine--tRNA ligase [Candidatus Dormibacteraeota bacterium]|nr:histidine--tRNA ligase [Candidatus Dormibacteraeota bacterium]